MKFIPRLSRWHLPVAVCACVPAALVAAGASSGSAAAPTTLRYVANEGVLVTVDGHRVLIDAPIRDGILPYATSPPEERRRLEQALPPYDDVEAVLITHWHEDHFSPDAVAAHLSHNARAVFVSSPEVVDRLRAAAPGLAASRVRAVLPAPGGVERVSIGDLAVRVLRLRHNPTRRLPEQHVGFLVGERAAVLHVGDADPAAGNFTVLQGQTPIDLALLPFWYVLDDANRALVRKVIAPRRIAAFHLPPGDAASVGRSLRAAGVRAALLAEPGTVVALAP